MRNIKMTEEHRIIRPGRIDAEISCTNMHIRNSKKHDEKVEHNRELFENVFPELIKKREERERLSHIGARVKTDADMDEIIDILQKQEKEKEKMFANAAMPPRILPRKQTENLILNHNDLIQDFEKEWNEGKNYLNMWTEKEKEIFREKYVHHPKNFVIIASFLDDKSVRECIQYYYNTKKKENYKSLAKRRIRTPRNKSSSYEVLKIMNDKSYMNLKRRGPVITLRRVNTRTSESPTNSDTAKSPMLQQKETITTKDSFSQDLPPTSEVTVLPTMSSLSLFSSQPENPPVTPIVVTGKTEDAENTCTNTKTSRLTSKTTKNTTINIASQEVRKRENENLQCRNQVNTSCEYITSSPVDVIEEREKIDDFQTIGRSSNNESRNNVRTKKIKTRFAAKIASVILSYFYYNKNTDTLCCLLCSKSYKSPGNLPALSQHVKLNHSPGLKKSFKAMEIHRPQFSPDSAQGVRNKLIKESKSEDLVSSSTFGGEKEVSRIHNFPSTTHNFPTTVQHFSSSTQKFPDPKQTILEFNERSNTAQFDEISKEIHIHQRKNIRKMPPLVSIYKYHPSFNKTFRNKIHPHLAKNRKHQHKSNLPQNISKKPMYSHFKSHIPMNNNSNLNTSSQNQKIDSKVPDFYHYPTIPSYSSIPIINPKLNKIISHQHQLAIDQRKNLDHREHCSTNAKYKQIEQLLQQKQPSHHKHTNQQPYQVENEKSHLHMNSSNLPQSRKQKIQHVSASHMMQNSSYLKPSNIPSKLQQYSCSDLHRDPKRSYSRHDISHYQSQNNDHQAVTSSTNHAAVAQITDKMSTKAKSCHLQSNISPNVQCISDSQEDIHVLPETKQTQYLMVDNDLICYTCQKLVNPFNADGHLYFGSVKCLNCGKILSCLEPACKVKDSCSHTSVEYLYTNPLFYLIKYLPLTIKSSNDLFVQYLKKLIPVCKYHPWRKQFEKLIISIMITSKAITTANNNFWTGNEENLKLYRLLKDIETLSLAKIYEEITKNITDKGLLNDTMLNTVHMYNLENKKSYPMTQKVDEAKHIEEIEINSSDDEVPLQIVEDDDEKYRSITNVEASVSENTKFDYHNEKRMRNYSSNFIEKNTAITGTNSKTDQKQRNQNKESGYCIELEDKAQSIKVKNTQYTRQEDEHIQKRKAELPIDIEYLNKGKDEILDYQTMLKEHPSFSDESCNTNDKQIINESNENLDKNDDINKEHSLKHLGKLRKHDVLIKDNQKLKEFISGNYNFANLNNRKELYDTYETKNKLEKFENHTENIRRSPKHNKQFPENCSEKVHNIKENINISIIQEKSENLKEIERLLQIEKENCKTSNEEYSRITLEKDPESVEFQGKEKYFNNSEYVDNHKTKEITTAMKHVCDKLHDLGDDKIVCKLNYICGSNNTNCCSPNCVLKENEQCLSQNVHKESSKCIYSKNRFPSDNKYNANNRKTKIFSDDNKLISKISKMKYNTKRGNANTYNYFENNNELKYNHFISKDEYRKLNYNDSQTFKKKCRNIRKRNKLHKKQKYRKNEDRMSILDIIKEGIIENGQKLQKKESYSKFKKSEMSTNNKFNCKDGSTSNKYTPEKSQAVIEKLHALQNHVQYKMDEFQVEIENIIFAREKIHQKFKLVEAFTDNERYRINRTTPNTINMKDNKETILTEGHNTTEHVSFIQKYDEFLKKISTDGVKIAEENNINSSYYHSSDHINSMLSGETRFTDDNDIATESHILKDKYKWKMEDIKKITEKIKSSKERIQSQVSFLQGYIEDSVNSNEENFKLEEYIKESHYKDNFNNRQEIHSYELEKKLSVHSDNNNTSNDVETNTKTADCKALWETERMGIIDNCETNDSSEEKLENSQASLLSTNVIQKLKKTMSETQKIRKHIKQQTFVENKEHEITDAYTNLDKSEFKSLNIESKGQIVAEEILKEIKEVRTQLKNQTNTILNTNDNVVGERDKLNCQMKITQLDLDRLQSEKEESINLNDNIKTIDDTFEPNKGNVNKKNDKLNEEIIIENNVISIPGEKFNFPIIQICLGNSEDLDIYGKNNDPHVSIIENNEFEKMNPERRTICESSPFYSVFEKILGDQMVNIGDISGSDQSLKLSNSIDMQIDGKVISAITNTSPNIKEREINKDIAPIKKKRKLPPLRSIYQFKPEINSTFNSSQSFSDFDKADKDQTVNASELTNCEQPSNLFRLTNIQSDLKDNNQHFIENQMQPNILDNNKEYNTATVERTFTEKLDVSDIPFNTKDKEIIKDVLPMIRKRKLPPLRSIYEVDSAFKFFKRDHQNSQFLIKPNLYDINGVKKYSNFSSTNDEDIITEKNTKEDKLPSSFNEEVIEKIEQFQMINEGKIMDGLRLQKDDKVLDKGKTISEPDKTKTDNICEVMSEKVNDVEKKSFKTDISKFTRETVGSTNSNCYVSSTFIKYCPVCHNKVNFTCNRDKQMLTTVCSCDLTIYILLDPEPDLDNPNGYPPDII